MDGCPLGILKYAHVFWEDGEDGALRGGAPYERFCFGKVALAVKRFGMQLN